MADGGWRMADGWLSERSRMPCVRVCTVCVCMYVRPYVRFRCPGLTSRSRAKRDLGVGDRLGRCILDDGLHQRLFAQARRFEEDWGFEMDKASWTAGRVRMGRSRD
jgi:hypothetical protein